MTTPVSRNHFLKVANGKSDHATLSKANARRKTRVEFCATKSGHWNERERRIAVATKVRSKKIVRSIGFPCSKALPPEENPSHIDGVFDPRKNNQIMGTHKAFEVSGFRAGSKQRSPERRTTQSDSAKEGGIVLRRFLGPVVRLSSTLGDTGVSDRRHRQTCGGTPEA
jgi:hypothetical protein